MRFSISPSASLPHSLVFSLPLQEKKDEEEREKERKRKRKRKKKEERRGGGRKGEEEEEKGKKILALMSELNTNPRSVTSLNFSFLKCQRTIAPTPKSCKEQMSLCV